MDGKTTFVRTNKGEDEARSKTSHLSGDIKRALLMVDGSATFAEISKRAAPSLRDNLEDMLKNLEKGGFVQDKSRVGNIPKMVVPPKMSAPVKKPTADEGVDELDFTAAFRPPSQEELAKQNIEAAKLKAQQEAEAARQKAEQEAARGRAELDAAKAKADAEARARALAEAKAKQEIEAARLKAEAEAKARAEVEAKARIEAEAKARREIEAAKLKAQQEAEVRLKAEREAAIAREEAELAKQKALAEAKLREEAERHAREAAEAARIKAEQEAARVRAELAAVKAQAEAEAKARQEAEHRAREQAEAARLKAQQEAEQNRLKAEQEAAQAREEAALAKQKAEAETRAREEAERRAKAEAEAARVKTEQEAARVRAELDAAKAKADAEAKAREEAERRAHQETEAAKLKAQREIEVVRLKAEQDAAQAIEEAETAKQKAETEIRAREESERLARQTMESSAGLKAQQETVKTRSGAYSAARSTSATVLFFDVVGYTKQPVNKQIEIKQQFNRLVSDCLAMQGDSERIILDTGDGAAIGFMQHPEDALEVAMQFRRTVMDNRHNDYPDLKVRIGIHLGPINVANDMNGRSNMVGDGINDAQRVMSFAGIDQIYISRSYYDFVSRLSDEYANLFHYRGALKDKHGREHPVYELVDGAAPVAEAVPSQAGEASSAVTLEPFSFVMQEAAAVPPISSEPASVAAYEKPETLQRDDEAALFKDIAQMNWEEETSKPVAAETISRQQISPASPPPAASVPEAAAPSEKNAPSAAAEIKESPEPVAPARMPSAEDVAKLAETQAKAWADAEQRGVETAKVKAEHAARQHHHPAPAAKDILAERGRSKPLPWGKLGVGLFALIVGALFAVPPLLPMRGSADNIEQLLTARLQQPVHIGRMAGRLLPTPRLEMSDVSVGETKQIQVQQARVNFALSALFSSSKPITGIELDGVQADGAALQQATVWLQKIAADTQYPVERITLNQGKLEADGVQLSDIGGELSFGGDGKFAKAKLHADGNKLGLDINATPEGKMAVSIAVRGGSLPLLPNWVFDDLTAKGELTGDELVITDLDGRIMGGMLLGDARIAWRSGWRAQGALTAKTIATQNLSRALNGDMDGMARFQMQSSSLAKLTEAATLDGNFVIKKGVINGFDVIETARQRSRENLPGGRTNFEELSGELSVANGIYNFRQLKMSGGVWNATGTLGITKQQLSGRISADLTKFSGMGTVALQLNGTTDNPALRAAH
ncbi:MAG: adenylate/guanylate cyclase domain-containing protein [Gallionella sp.]|nr:adenylate/guanylate cyclase domain-containing protein [Gallionella sp.]